MLQDAEKLAALRQIMTDRLSDSELRTLSFDSGVDYQDLSAPTKPDLTRELLLYHVRRNSLHILVKAGKGLRPDINWDSAAIPSYQNTTIQNEQVIYNSRYEIPPFASWTYYGNLNISAERIQFSQEHPEGCPTLSLSCPADEHVGANKSLRTLSGTIQFDYKAIQSDHLASNILFCIIPMQEPGIGRTGLIEVGTNVQGDPRNAFSPYRQRYFVPRDHIGNNEWHQVTMRFDFRQMDTAFYSIFAPRINEGCHVTASGKVLISNIQVIV